MIRRLRFPFVIRIGLGCVFLANSLTAFLSPSEFQDLVGASFVAHFLPVSVVTFVSLVALHDCAVALLLFFGWRTSAVAAYACLWFAAVITVIGIFTLDALEHLGFLSMALSLAFRDKTRH